MNVCIDIGNTLEKLSVFDGDQERFFKRVERIDKTHLAYIKNEYNIKGLIICSTKKIDENRLDLFKSYGDLVMLDHNTPIPINNLYHTPETLGKDRLAGVVAANTLFKNENNIVLSLGTCITMDVIDAKGNYQGGNIHPGLSMRLKAMHHFTQKLPLVPVEMPQDIIGKSTIHALQNGSLKGAIWEIESFIAEIKQIFDNPNIILTGGDSRLFEVHINFKIFAVPNLVLIGLNTILNHRQNLKL
jgi:type III pantothenate kinase